MEVCVSFFYFTLQPAALKLWGHFLVCAEECRHGLSVAGGGPRRRGMRFAPRGETTCGDARRHPGTPSRPAAWPSGLLAAVVPLGALEWVALSCRACGKCYPFECPRQAKATALQACRKWPFPVAWERVLGLAASSGTVCPGTGSYVRGFWKWSSR